jgi:hypothetical protein
MNIYAVSEEMEVAQFFTIEEKMHEYAINRAKEIIDSIFDNEWSRMDLLELKHTEEERLDYLLSWDSLPIEAGEVEPNDGHIDPEWFGYSNFDYVYCCPWAEDIIRDYALMKLRSIED